MDTMGCSRWVCVVLLLVLANHVSAELRWYVPTTADRGKLCYLNGVYDTGCGTAFAAGEWPRGGIIYWFRGYLRFDITGLSGTNINSAVLHVIKDSKPVGTIDGTIQLQRVNDFGSTIGLEDWNIGVKETITTDIGTGSVNEDVTSALQTEIDASSDYIALRLMGTVEDWDLNGDFIYYSWGGTSAFYMDLNITCTSHSNCPSATYCASNGFCASEIGNGADCASKEYSRLSDNEVCSSGYCYDDNWDGSGEFCADSSTDCVHDGGSYDNGYRFCSGSSQYKTCSFGSWGADSYCDTTTDYQLCNGNCGWQSQMPDSCTNGVSGGCSVPGWGSCSDCGEYTAWSGGSSAGCNSNLASCSKTCGSTCELGEVYDTVEDKCTSNNVYNVIAGCASSGSDCYWNDGVVADTLNDDCMENCYGDYCGGTNSAHWYDYYMINAFSDTYYNVCVNSGTSDYCASAPSYCYTTESTSCDTANCGAQCDSGSDYSANYGTETCSYSCDTSNACAFTQTIDCDTTGCGEGDGTGDCVDCRCSGAKLGDVNCALNTCSGSSYTCAAENYPNYNCVEGSCGAVCDSSQDYSWNDGSNTCLHDCNTTTSCAFSETTNCPDFCIDDGNGGTCAKTTRADPSTGETCYWGDTCSGAGCSLVSSGTLRQNYCDYCISSGVVSGDYSPSLTSICDNSPKSEDCPDDGLRYYDETQSRADDCDGSGNSLVLTETLARGDVWDSSGSAAYCNDNECHTDCQKAEFGSHTGGICTDGECVCNDQPTVGETVISPTNADQNDVITLSAVCTDINGESDMVSCGFDTDQVNAYGVTGSLDTSYGNGDEAVCTATAGVTDSGDIEYRAWCEDGDEDDSGINYGSWNRDAALRRDILVGGSEQIDIPVFNYSDNKDVWFRKLVTISGNSGDGAPATFTHTLQQTLESGVDYWMVCEGNVTSVGCTNVSSGTGNVVDYNVTAGYSGTDYETILDYYNGADLVVGEWSSQGVGNDSRQSVVTTITLTEDVNEDFVVDYDVSGIVPGAISCYENCSGTNVSSNGGWTTKALAYGDWVTYPDACQWVQETCNLSENGKEHIVCSLENFRNSFTASLDVVVGAPSLPSGSWDCSDPTDDCNFVTITSSTANDTSYTFDSYDDVVSMTESGWVDNGTCSEFTRHVEYRVENVSFDSSSGMSMSCSWDVIPDVSYNCSFCSAITGVPDGGTYFVLQEERYCNSPVVIDDIQNQTALEDSIFALDINAADADDDSLTWSDNVSFGYIDLSTGVWSWTPTNDDIGNYTIEVSVEDGQGSSDSIIMYLRVVNTGDAPTFDPEPVIPSIEEDNSLEYDVNATDVDGDSLNYFVNDSEVSINPETGVLTWTPLENWFGNKTILITVSDGLFATIKTVTLTVLPVNDPPGIEPIEDQVAQTDQTFTYLVNATDVDGDDLTFADNTGLFDIIEGSIEFTPSSNDVGIYDIEINVSDYEYMTSESFVITVTQTTSTSTSTTSSTTTTSTVETTTTLPIVNGLVTVQIRLSEGWNLVSFPIIPYEGPPTCNDGVINGNETGVDCGGECAPCPPPTCDDSIMNGNETWVDCGGPDCDPCPPTCSDGLQNGNETDVDCGGLDCTACHCIDGEWNYDEDWIDCGGVDCLLCPPLPPGFNISFSSGWNLFSIPEEIPGMTAETLCTNISDSGTIADRVKEWNPVDKEYTTHPCRSEFLDFGLLPNWAYWMNVNGSVELEMSGSETDTTPNLVDGWNLIGWNSRKNTTAKNWTLSVGADTITRWTGDGYSYYHNGTEINNFVVTRVEGYWIHKGEAESPNLVSVQSGQYINSFEADVPGPPYGLIGRVYCGNGSWYSGIVNLTNTETDESLVTETGLVGDGSYEFDLFGYKWSGDNLTVTAGSGNASNSTWIIPVNTTGSLVVPDIVVPCEVEQSTPISESEGDETTTTISDDKTFVNKTEEGVISIAGSRVGTMFTLIGLWIEES